MNFEINAQTYLTFNVQQEAIENLCFDTTKCRSQHTYKMDLCIDVGTTYGQMTDKWRIESKYIR